jgi:DNA-binding Lrp family transcriptional regulator
MQNSVSAVVLINAEPNRINELAESMTELKGVAEVFSVAGQVDLVAIVRVGCNDDLAELISGKILKLPGIRETRTLIAFRVFTRSELEEGGLNLD